MFAQQRQYQPNYGYNDPYTMNTNERKPVDNLLNQYLRQEGIDKRYSKLILNELYDATQMTNDQLNRAANEIIVKQPSNL